MGALMQLNPSPHIMDEQAFVAAYGGVYEHSPWIARTAWQRGLTPEHADPAILAATMAAIVSEADRAVQMDLIRAHPDLAGRAAIAGDLTHSSRSEQSGAGLDRCTPDEYRRFGELNDAYKAKFGFPFILAVAGRGRAEILANFETRLENGRDAEFAEALRQVDRIALIRLEAMAAGG